MVNFEDTESVQTEHLKEELLQLQEQNSELAATLSKLEEEKSAKVADVEVFDRLRLDIKRVRT
jgi:hypothetical protein